MAALAVIGFVVFVWRELRADKPMVDLRLFNDRNLSVATALIFLTSVLIYGIGLLTPQFLQQLIGYTSLWAGIATAPLGIGAVISMVVVGALVSRLDPRLIATMGLLLFATAAFSLSRITLGITPWTVFWPQVVAGLAMGFLFVPVNVAGTAPLRRDQIGSATGSMNLMRNVGGSVGIALVSTFLARRSQVHQTVLSQNFNPAIRSSCKASTIQRRPFSPTMWVPPTASTQPSACSTSTCSSSRGCSLSAMSIRGWFFSHLRQSCWSFSSAESRSRVCRSFTDRFA
jgi:DHA2 family multidrug resistance protein